MLYSTGSDFIECPHCGAELVPDELEETMTCPLCDEEVECDEPDWDFGTC